MRSEALAVVAVGLPAVLAPVLWLLPQRWVTWVAVVGAIGVALIATTVAALGLLDAAHPLVNDWLALDAAGATVLGVIALVGLIAVLTSPGYLSSGRQPPDGGDRPATYYSVLFVFWSALIALPLAGNLALTVLVAEATTAASALLVGYSRSRRALEAGWKYLILTSLGLGVAMLGVLLLANGMPNPGVGALSWRALPAFSAGGTPALLAYLLVLAGLAAKIGLAPVHNWLPDAHAEAPAPISAMLSSALLPAVMLVAWRVEQAMAPVLGAGVANGVVMAFGLVSVAVAIPFVVRPLAWKRLLAYSTLEHMGVVALGIGFGTPLAMAGVAVHLVGHAIAKTLGFSAAVALIAHAPRSAGQAVSGVGRTQRGLAAAMGLSLGTLSGLPPMPLFVSELLILAGGFGSRWPVAAAVATLLLAVAFVGLLRSLVETTIGDEPEMPDQPTVDGQLVAEGATAAPLAGLRGVKVLAVVSAVLLLILSGLSVVLPQSELAEAFLKGVQ